MYESPIEIFLSEIETSIKQEEENAVLEAVVSVGVNVDKEELIKALQYDRGQYEKGYADGCRDSRKQGRWIPLEADGYADGYPVYDLWECSECREEHSGDEDTLTHYCPHCGARMDGGNEDG